MKKMIPYTLVGILGIIQCIQVFHIGLLPSWIHSLSLVLLILTIILIRLDQMDRNLKAKSTKEGTYEYHIRCKSN